MTNPEMPEFLILDQQQLALILQAIQEHLANGPKTKAPFQLGVGIELCFRVRETAIAAKADPRKLLDGFLNMLFATGMMAFFNGCMAEHFDGKPEELERVLSKISAAMRAGEVVH